MRRVPPERVAVAFSGSSNLSASKACFSIAQKYSKFPDMLIAYVWNVSEPGKTRIYVVNQEEAVRIASAMKYTDTESWINKGTYVVTRPSPKLVEMLRPYEVSQATWEDQIRKIADRKV